MGDLYEILCEKCLQPLPDPVGVILNEVDDIDDIFLGSDPLGDSRSKNSFAAPAQGSHKKSADQMCFEYFITGNTVVIVETCANAMPLYKDMGNILLKIKQAFPDLPRHKIIYRDHSGVYCGVKMTEQGEFDAFYLINTPYFDKALRQASCHAEQGFKHAHFMSYEEIDAAANISQALEEWFRVQTSQGSNNSVSYLSSIVTELIVHARSILNLENPAKR